MSKGNRIVFLAIAMAALVISAVSWQEYFNPKIVVEWSTASELDAAGFNIYRGETETGPFEQINPALIPASEDPLTGGAYVFTDRAVQTGQRYIYQLEEVELTGATQIIGTTTFETTRLAIIPAVLATLLFLGALWGILPFGKRNHTQSGSEVL